MGNSFDCTEVAKSFKLRNIQKISQIPNKRTGALPNPSKKFPFEEHMKKWKINLEASQSSVQAVNKEEKPPIINEKKICRFSKAFTFLRALLFKRADPSISVLRCGCSCSP